MKINLIEMEGLLRGQCIPGDLIVNETLAEYLVRKFDVLNEQLAESRRELTAANATIHNLELKVERVVAENAALKQCAVNYENAVAHWNSWADAEDKIPLAPETPATDAFLAEVRASAIPDGYKLVPKHMYLDAEDVKAISMQCGNGDKKGYGDYEDGILWIGELSNDGEMKYGLNIANANYPEEGSITVFEFDEPLFAAQLRQGSEHE